MKRFLPLPIFHRDLLSDYWQRGRRRLATPLPQQARQVIISLLPPTANSRGLARDREVPRLRSAAADGYQFLLVCRVRGWST